jgi:hypothetical protein
MEMILLCLIMNHAMKKHGKMEVQIQELLTSGTKYPNWTVLTAF